MSQIAGVFLAKFVIIREKYDLMEYIKAKFVAPRLDEVFSSSQSWQTLSKSSKLLETYAIGE